MLSQQVTHKLHILISHHREIRHGTGRSEVQKRWWNRDDTSDVSSNTRSNWNLNSWRSNLDSPWNVRTEDYDEAPPLFPEPVLAWFFLQKSGLEARERNMILATTVSR